MSLFLYDVHFFLLRIKVLLLLAKITILARVCVCRFLCLTVRYLPKLKIFVWRCVCVFVRQSVVVAIAHERLDQSTPNLTQICIPVAVKVCVLFSVDDVINDVIRSKNRLKFWTSVTPSIFKLERWSKAQNIANARGYLAGIFDFRYHIRWKSSK